jgi:cytochrome oxidase assembly protein ShyY1
VSIAGTYLADQQVLVVNRSQGGEPGRNAVAILRLDDGRALLVNRGFVPSLQPVPPPPAGRVELIGRLKTSEQRRLGQASDSATPGSTLTEVRRIDLATLAPQVGLPLVPMYLEVLSSQPTEPSPPYPIASPALTEGPHLSYAVQWFVFSASALVGWVFAVRHSVRERQSRAPRRRRPPPIADDLGPAS